MDHPTNIQIYLSIIFIRDLLSAYVNTNIRSIWIFYAHTLAHTRSIQRYTCRKMHRFQILLCGLVFSKFFGSLSEFPRSFSKFTRVYPKFLEVSGVGWILPMFVGVFRNFPELHHRVFRTLSEFLRRLSEFTRDSPKNLGACRIFPMFF